MKLKINGNQEDFGAMIISSVRYALGRRTYIVAWTCGFIINNKHLLTEEDRNVIIKDIRSQEKFGYGDECDKQEWLRLLEVLEK